MFVITVTGKDRPGIIASLTGALYDSGGNLEDASMTILEGEFAMIFLAELDTKPLRGKLRPRLEKLEKTLGLVISVKEIEHRLVRGEKHRAGTIPWIVSVLGKDKAGIVYQISKVLAAHGLNITDLNSKIIGRGPKTSYALVLEVDIPRKSGVHFLLKKKFRQIEKKLGLSISFNPVESSQF
ncbi:MAG: hypothetical protein HY585_03100 [Candidatus Omnitrophica bacterium]|nr:hypothetical protein [Candidatus Omnitrophota bacterium]